MSDSSGLPVLYRDDCLLAVSKPSGMVVHRGWATDKRTVYDIVRDEIIGAPVYAIHRLDRGTSGVLVFALDSLTAQFMQEQMNSGSIYKSYLALVRGPMRDRVYLNHPVKQPPLGDRIDAITEFIPLCHSGRWSLIEARPLTGRSHQIRLHLKHLSHPIIGDVRHGKGDVNRLFREKHGFVRLALHAWKMTLPRPNADALELHADVPTDFGTLLNRLQLTVFD